jgi:hypothetical protein
LGINELQTVKKPLFLPKLFRGLAINELHIAQTAAHTRPRTRVPENRQKSPFCFDLPGFTLST